jgi:glycosyltransferase involved in cell wall biosynthesis
LVIAITSSVLFDGGFDRECGATIRLEDHEAHGSSDERQPGAMGSQLVISGAPAGRPILAFEVSRPKILKERSELRWRMRYLVAIPVYNEAKTLATVLRQVREYANDILVVDDGSTDDTPRLLEAEKGISVIRHIDNRGYGQSLIDAFRFATARDYDWLITMDCDEQHEPAWIPFFQEAASQDDADIISGSRYLQPLPGSSKAPVDRRAINQKMTEMLNETLGLRITDAFCGFKAYRVSALRKLNINVPGYGMPIQFWVQAARQGLRIAEIPVRLIYNDPNRYFGGSLDDPDARLLYYYDVLVYALAEQINWPARSESGRTATADVSIHPIE